MAKDINKVLNDFLVQQKLDDELVARYEAGSDSYYQEYSSVDTPDLVVLGGMSDKQADEVYMEYCGELGLEVPMSVEAMSFLHEVGHYITMPFLDDDEKFSSELVKMHCYMLDERTNESFRDYFDCPIEKEATLDAVRFCNACPEVAMELSKDIEEALYGVS